MARMSDPKPERAKLELSPIKVAAGAAAAATAAAIGSTLGVAGTIAGAAVASVVATAASAVISHSLERGKYAALKVRPLYQHATDAGTAEIPHARISEAAVRSAALDETVVLPGGPNDQTVMLPAVPPVVVPAVLPAAGLQDAETWYPPRVGANEARRAAASAATPAYASAPATATATVLAASWTSRLPSRKSIAAVTMISFVIGLGTLSAEEGLRGRAIIPGSNGSVLQNQDNGKQRGQGPSTTPDAPAPRPPGTPGTAGKPGSPDPGTSVTQPPVSTPPTLSGTPATPAATTANPATTAATTAATTPTAAPSGTTTPTGVATPSGG